MSWQLVFRGFDLLHLPCYLQNGYSTVWTLSVSLFQTFIGFTRFHKSKLRMKPQWLKRSVNKANHYQTADTVRSGKSWFLAISTLHSIYESINHSSREVSICVEMLVDTWNLSRNNGQCKLSHFLPMRGEIMIVVRWWKSYQRQWSLNTCISFVLSLIPMHHSNSKDNKFQKKKNSFNQHQRNTRVELEFSLRSEPQLNWANNVAVAKAKYQHILIHQIEIKGKERIYDRGPGCDR